jgi:hypothetical protein
MKAALAVWSTFFLAVAPAFAVLGESVESVHSDQQHLRGQLISLARAEYTLHQIGAPDGTVVREYASPDGRIFGIAWQGPTMPDLSQLLGSHFAEFQQAARSGVRRRGPVVVRVDQLVLESGGHLRSFHGRAYLTDLLPDNVSEAVVR